MLSTISPLRKWKQSLILKQLQELVCRFTKCLARKMKLISTIYFHFGETLNHWWNSELTLFLILSITYEHIKHQVWYCKIYRVSYCTPKPFDSFFKKMGRIAATCLGLMKSLIISWCDEEPPRSSCYKMKGSGTRWGTVVEESWKRDFCGELTQEGHREEWGMVVRCLIQI